MIRTNLSTRPFYNDRAVRVWLAIGLLLVIAATLFNVTRMLQFSGTNTELVAQASRDEARVSELRATAAGIRGSVDPKQIETASTDARQANDLIDRRTFSWTELFNRFETTLPANVRITSVRPSLDEARQTVLLITVVARAVEDVNQFMENLDATGAFARLTPTQERINDDDQVESVLSAIYLSQTPAGPTPDAPAAVVDRSAR